MRLAAIILFISSIHGMAQVTPSHRDISYGPHERHKLDVWQAKTKAPAPLVIFIHGGGWHGGDKGDIPMKLVEMMLAHGLSVASINYRYTRIAPLPAPVHDAARAVQFLRTKAGDWQLDPQRFGAYGISAGGCTTLWLACHTDLADPRGSDPINQQSSRLQAAVGFSPQTSLEPEVVTTWIGEQVLRHGMIARAVGAKSFDEMKSPTPEQVKLLREFSPITHVTADDPPMMLSYPRKDPLPAATPGSAIHHAILGMKFKEQADAVGVSCLLRVEDQNPTLPKPEEFLIEHLCR